MTRARSGTADLPLLAWGDALRAGRQHRRALRRRATIIAAGIGLVALTIAMPPRPRLVWNASASAPIGLYTVAPDQPIAPGDMVIARVPERYRMLAATRRYLPLNVPLVKHVAAAAGDQICALGPSVSVEGRPVAVRRTTDGRGRAMPWWRGCVRLRGRQLFLLTDSPDSFDGRYFGVTEGADVIGKARLLWAKPTRASRNG